MRISDWSSDVCSSDLLDIVGTVEPGRSVGRGRSRRLERLVEIGHILAAAEHQMLEQMGKAGLALGLVLRPDAIISRHPADRRLAIGVDEHGPPVAELDAPDPKRVVYGTRVTVLSTTGVRGSH